MTAILSVSSLNELAKQLLESNLSGVRVQGEVRSLVKAASGHVYFTLKDAGAEVRCALFRGQALRIKTVFANGDAVEVRGSVSLYAPRGDYQLIISAVELAGDGQLAVLFEVLKKKLYAEGLFDAARKRPLPPIPKHIVVISSAVGAALADVLAVLARRMPLARITLFATAVQGETAAAELTRAVQRITPDACFEAGFDVALIVRGGGSMSDLWAFNDEALARAMIACPIPVVSGVGHEIDFTISDFVADVRAATPTAAAELATAVTLIEIQQQLAARALQLARGMMSRLNGLGQRLDQAMSRLKPIGVPTGHSQRLVLELRLMRALRARLQRQALPLSSLIGRLNRQSPTRWVQTNQTHLAAMAQRLQRAWTQNCHQQRQTLTEQRAKLAPAQAFAQLVQRQHNLARWREALDLALGSRLHKEHQRTQQAKNILNALSPQRVLERGYSVIESEHGVLTSTRALTRLFAPAPHSVPLTLHFADGALAIAASQLKVGENS